jgi:hypothetical protein
MDTKAFRSKKMTDEIENRDSADRSHLVHHVGPVGTGLFPGWGPKL